MVTTACFALGRIGKGNLEVAHEIAKLLTHNSSGIRNQAGYELGHIGVKDSEIIKAIQTAYKKETQKNPFRALTFAAKTLEIEVSDSLFEKNSRRYKLEYEKQTNK